ncbi:MAG: hypothetical protein ACYSYV_09845 [Planctomycetota bacterium]
MNVTAFHTSDYGNTPAPDSEESEPNQSQFQTGRLLVSRMCRIFFNPTAKKGRILKSPRRPTLETLAETGKVREDI